MWYAIEHCTRARTWHRARHGASSDLRVLTEVEIECASALAHLIMAWRLAAGSDRRLLGRALRAVVRLIPSWSNLPRELARFFYFRRSALASLPLEVVPSRLSRNQKRRT